MRARHFHATRSITHGWMDAYGTFTRTNLLIANLIFFKVSQREIQSISDPACYICVFNLLNCHLQPAIAIVFHNRQSTAALMRTYVRIHSCIIYDSSLAYYGPSVANFTSVSAILNNILVRIYAQCIFAKLARSHFVSQLAEQDWGVGVASCRDANIGGKSSCRKFPIVHTVRRASIYTETNRQKFKKEGWHTST